MEMTYDAAGHVVTERTPGNETRYIYDDAGRLVGAQSFTPGNAQPQYQEAIDYDERSARMFVNLRDGKRYVYFMVPRQEYEAFLRAESKGTHLNTVIKPRFRAEELA